MDKLVKNIEEFIAWTKKLDGRLLLYRGLANSDWEVESSAHRRIKESQGASPPPIVFQNYIARLLESAGLQGFRERQDKRLSDLELMAELQHYGAATCLIDFTTNALIALWFACEEKSDKAGKVVAMETSNPQKFSEIGYEDLKHKTIKEFLNTGKLWKWSPSSLNNRIVAQQSVFVFGEGNIGESYYEEIEIDSGSKQSIKETLEKLYGIKEQQLFNDFAGFALCNAHDKPYNEFTAKDFFYLGVTFQQQGKYKKAIDYYDKAIEHNPKSADAYYNRGIAKRALGDYKAAIADYDKAIEYNPKSVDAYYSRGIAKRALGDYKAAIADYDKAIEHNPKSADAYYNRGTVKYALGDYKAAIADYDKVIEYNPKSADAYYYRGTAKGKLGDYEGAISDCNKAIEHNPEYAAAYHNRGVAKRALGNEIGANEDFATAQKLDPNGSENGSN